METESVINTLPTEKISGLEGFTAESYQDFYQELIPILRLFQKIERKELSKISMKQISPEVNITLIPKP